MSSTYLWTIQLACKSLINTTNARDPDHDPCGIASLLLTTTFTMLLLLLLINTAAIILRTRFTEHTANQIGLKECLDVNWRRRAGRLARFRPILHEEDCYCLGQTVIFWAMLRQVSWLTVRQLHWYLVITTRNCKSVAASGYRLVSVDTQYLLQ